MKRLLLISYYYWPDNSIGAVRPTKICKYLSDEYKIDVLTVKREGENVYRGQFADKIYEIVPKESFFKVALLRFSQSRIYQFFRKKDIKDKQEQSNIGYDTKHEGESHNSISILRKISMSFFAFSVITDDHHFFMNGKKVMKQVLKNKYDVIISEFPTMSDQSFAYIYKKKNPDVIWIADFRDPVIREESPLIVKLNYRKWLKKIERYADYVVSVNDECLKEISLKKAKNISISNGYDEDDFDLTSSKHINDKLTFVYTGTMYPAHSDFGPLFKSIKELGDCGKIDINDIKIIYMGRDGNLICRQAEPYNFLNIVEDKGVVSRNESIKQQKNADVLLLASWNSKKEKGVITGKFYEYLVNRRPVLCFMTGEVPNSMLKEYISNNNLGYCFEMANIKNDYNELKDYICGIYNEYKNTERVSYTGNEEFIKSFSYENLSKKWKAILSE